MILFLQNLALIKVVLKAQSGLSEKEVIKIMQSHMQPSSFRMWRKRVSGRASKHRAKL